MVDLFKTAGDVLILIKSCLEVFSLSKNQTEDVTTDRDADNIMILKSKNGKKWRIIVEEIK